MEKEIKNEIEYPIMLDDRDKGYGTKLTNLCPTQRAERYGLKIIESNGGNFMNKELRIRKLTPCECMKLMGFTPNDYQALKDIGLSDSAIYHCAGDSIVVPCLVSLLSPFVNEEHEHIRIVEEYVERNIANGKESKNI